MADTPRSPHDERLSAFLASSPPRAVPEDFRKSALAQSAALVPALVVSFLGLISLVLTFFFFPRHLLADWQLSRPSAAVAPGKILSDRLTTISENHRRVFEYTFAFTPPHGSKVTGTCYTTGPRFKAGDALDVRYLPKDPSTACPIGARLSQTSPLSCLLVLFPTFSLVFLVITLRARGEVRRILEFGELSEARVIAVGPPNGFRARNTRKEIRLLCGSETILVPVYRVSLADFARDRFESNQPVYLLRAPSRQGKVLFPERF